MFDFFRKMDKSNRSLSIAMLACVALYFFAKTPLFYGDKEAFSSKILFGLTISLTIIGIFVGMAGAREKGTWWSYLGVAVNALLCAAVFAFFSLLMQ